MGKRRPGSLAAAAPRPLPRVLADTPTPRTHSANPPTLPEGEGGAGVVGKGVQAQHRSNFSYFDFGDLAGDAAGGEERVIASATSFYNALVFT